MAWNGNAHVPSHAGPDAMAPHPSHHHHVCSPHVCVRTSMHMHTHQISHALYMYVCMYYDTHHLIIYIRESSHLSMHAKPTYMHHTHGDIPIHAKHIHVPIHTYISMRLRCMHVKKPIHPWPMHCVHGHYPFMKKGLDDIWSKLPCHPHTIFGMDVNHIHRRAHFVPMYGHGHMVCRSMHVYLYVCALLEMV